MTVYYHLQNFSVESSHALSKATRGLESVGLHGWPDLACRLFSRGLPVKDGFPIWAEKKKVVVVLNISWHLKNHSHFGTHKCLTETWPHKFVYRLSVAAFALQQQSWTVQTTWPTKPKIFTVCVEQVYWAVPAPAHLFFTAPLPPPPHLDLNMRFFGRMYK